MKYDMYSQWNNACNWNILDTFKHPYFWYDHIPFLHENLHALQWRHDERDGVSNRQPHDFLLKLLYYNWNKELWSICVDTLSFDTLPIFKQNTITMTLHDSHSAQIISDSSVSWTFCSGYPQKNLVTDRQSVSMSWRHLAMFLYAFAPSSVGGKGHQAVIHISWHVIGFCPSGNLQTLGISIESSVTKWHEHAFYIITTTWHSFFTNDIHNQWCAGSPPCSVFISK